MEKATDSFERKPPNAPARKLHHGAAVTSSELNQHKRLISKEEWRVKVLPPKLVKAWADAPGLFQLIKSALRLGFAADVENAASHLIEIDQDHQRSHVTRSVVLMRLKRPQEAEKLLLAHVESHGASRIILTNLAKVYDELSDAAKAKKTLLEALALPQCPDSSLHWWGEMQRDIGGETAHLEILQRTAAIRGSWLPSLWHARHSLMSKDIKRAMTLYKQSIIASEGDADVLAVISNDLKRHELYREMIDLLQPLYDPARHGPLVGLNMLASCVKLSDVSGGKKLLHEMFKHYRNDLRNHLQHYVAEFLRSSTGVPDDVATADNMENQSLFSIELPLWWYGLLRPSWLLSSEKTHGLLILPFSRLNTATDSEAGEITDGICQAMPLLLAESLLYTTTFQPVVSFPVNDVFALRVPHREWRIEEVIGTAMAMDPRPPLALTGFFDEAGKKLVLHLYDIQSRKCAAVLTYSGVRQDLGGIYEGLVRDVQARLGAAGGGPAVAPDWHIEPAAIDVAPCLRSLELSLGIFLQHNQIVPARDNAGAMAELRDLAKQASSTQLQRLLYAAALMSDEAGRGRNRTEHYPDLSSLVSSDPASLFYRLSPYFMKTFDDKGFRARHSGLMSGAGEDYAAWLVLISDALDDYVLMDV
jgi:tetratricopeptide (TPR) repeat protein